MKNIIFTFAILSIFSCRSIDRFQTSAYPSLAPLHQTIAVLPIELVGQKFSDKVSEEERVKLLAYESSEIQNSIYSNILKTSGSSKRDIKINIKSINSTNKILADNKVDISNIGDYSEEDLADMLEVDAILRTRIDSPVLLTSREEDFPKELLNVATIFSNNPLLHRAGGIDVASVVIRSELIDSNEGISIWAYDKKRDLQLRDKNTDLMRTLTGDICRNFPYREESRRVD